MSPSPVSRPPLPILAKLSWPDATEPPSAETAVALATAAERLVSGQLVAIPTETVYGLAAHALDPDAVALIFGAKGRPANNPLIVHVADIAMAQRLVEDWPEVARRAAAAFWPGPLTLVLPKSAAVPDIVTAGGPTVAVRCPSLAITRKLIEQADCPLAAPSANRSEAVSPTTAQHVLESLGNKVGMILDAGPCEHGLESTVLDCTVDPPRILRPGPLSADQIAAAIGGPVMQEASLVSSSPNAAGQGTDTVARSPGQRVRHYAPRTPLIVTSQAADLVNQFLTTGKRVGWLSQNPHDASVRGLAVSADLVVVPMPDTPAAYGRSLYATLHALDQRQLDQLVADDVPAGNEWAAVRDRLLRASS